MEECDLDIGGEDGKERERREGRKKEGKERRVELDSDRSEAKPRDNAWPRQK